MISYPTTDRRKTNEKTEIFHEKISVFFLLLCTIYPQDYISISIFALEKISFLTKSLEKDRKNCYNGLIGEFSSKLLFFVEKDEGER